MSDPDLRLMLRRLLQELDDNANSRATSAANGVVAAAEDVAEGIVDDHNQLKTGVHGVGPLFVAKTRNSTQYVDWSEIQGKPDLSDLGVDESTIEIAASQVVSGIFDPARLPIADAGESNAFEVVRANDPRLTQQQYTLPVGEVVAAGDWVTVYNDGGTEKIKPADASSPDTAAIGFVAESYGVAAAATVFPVGVNIAAYLPGVTLANLNDTVFLSTTAGKPTLTPPSTAGQIVQPLGAIVEIQSATLASILVRWEFRFTL